MDHEYYFSIHAPEADTLEEALKICREKLAGLLNAHELPSSSIILLRFFLSDVCNQTPVIERLWPSDHSCQRVYIGQQPLDSAYLSLQAWCLDAPVEKQLTFGRLSVAPRRL